MNAPIGQHARGRAGQKTWGAGTKNEPDAGENIHQSLPGVKDSFSA